MKIKNLLLCVVLLCVAVAGCATPPATKNAAPQAAALGVLTKNLKEAYPPLSSYFVLPAGPATLRVFLSSDHYRYRCRVYDLTPGQTYTGQTDASSQLAKPTLTTVRYTKDHDVDILFSRVKKISTSPGTPPPDTGSDFPSYTDIALQDGGGATLDTITVAAARAGDVVSALFSLCPNVVRPN